MVKYQLPTHYFYLLCQGRADSLSDKLQLSKVTKKTSCSLFILCISKAHTPNYKFSLMWNDLPSLFHTSTPLDNKLHHHKSKEVQGGLWCLHPWVSPWFLQYQLENKWMNNFQNKLWRGMCLLSSSNQSFSFIW